MWPEDFFSIDLCLHTARSLIYALEKSACDSMKQNLGLLKTKSPHINLIFVAEVSGLLFILVVVSLHM